MAVLAQDRLDMLLAPSSDAESDSSVALRLSSASDSVGRFDSSSPIGGYRAGVSADDEVDPSVPDSLMLPPQEEREEYINHQESIAVAVSREWVRRDDSCSDSSAMSEHDQESTSNTDAEDVIHIGSPPLRLEEDDAPNENLHKDDHDAEMSSPFFVYPSADSRSEEWSISEEGAESDSNSDHGGLQLGNSVKLLEYDEDGNSDYEGILSTHSLGELELSRSTYSTGSSDTDYDTSNSDPGDTRRDNYN
jgi:hypothetical protein